MAANPAVLHTPVVLGVLVSLSNPFWFIWWVTVGAAFIVRSFDLGVHGITAFYLGHILACAVFIALLGAYFILSGLRFLVQG